MVDLASSCSGFIWLSIIIPIIIIKVQELRQKIKLKLLQNLAALQLPSVFSYFLKYIELVFIKRFIMFKAKVATIPQQQQTFYNQIKQILERKPYNWLKQARNGESVYLIHRNSLHQVLQHQKMMARQGELNPGIIKGLINQAIIQQKDNQYVYSDSVLKSQYSSNKQKIEEELIVINTSVHDQISKKLCLTGWSIQRKVLLEKGIKYIQYFPKTLEVAFINQTHLSQAQYIISSKGQIRLKSKQLTKIKLNISTHDNYYRFKQKLQKVCQQIHLPLASPYRIYEYNQSLFEVFSFQELLSHYYLKQNVPMGLNQIQDKFYQTIQQPNNDQFLIQITPGKLITYQNLTSVIQNTFTLIVEHKNNQNSKWVFPEQPQDSIAIECSYCLIKVQSLLSFLCQNCHGRYAFCSRLCHFSSLSSHGCPQAKQQLEQIYCFTNDEINNASNYQQLQNDRFNSFLDNGQQVKFFQVQDHNESVEQKLCKKSLDMSVLSDDNTSRISISSNGREVKLNLNDTSVLSSSHSNMHPSAWSQWMGGGLANLGNTCYINSVIQNIFRTSLTDDFLRYETFIISNLKSILCQAYLKLIKDLSSLQNAQSINYNQMGKFKDAVDQTMSLFEGYEQQDAHQFLIFLFDKVNEEFNYKNSKNKVQFQPNSIKKLTSVKRQEDEARAQVSWLNFVYKNNSPVIGNFYGQCKQQIYCPYCKTKYTTFEPFNMISLSIPENIHERKVRYEQYPFKKKIKQYSIEYCGSTVNDLFAATIKRLQIPQSKIHEYRLFLLFQEQKSIYLHDKTQSLESIKSSAKSKFFLFHCQIPNPTIIFFKFVYNSKPVTFKRPFFFKETKININKMQILYAAVAQYLCKIADTYGLDNKKYIREKLQLNVESYFKLHIFTEEQLLDKRSVLYNRYKPVNSLITNDLLLLDYEVHIELLKFHQKDPSLKVFHEHILQKLEKSIKIDKVPFYIPLEDCLHRQYNRFETLGNGNEWLCEICNKKRRVHKRTDLYKANKYLILQLKRFKQVDDKLIKNKTKINIPIELDLKEILKNHYLPETYYQNLLEKELTQLDLRISDINDKPSCTFNLIGMILHKGDGIKRGHYYAICKVSSEEWLLYNDELIEPIRLEPQRLLESLPLENIYILFYQRTFKQQNIL